jgi:elongation of very long chain fatty acids protein 7
LGVKYVPTGHLTFFGWLNAFVHIIMYTYYMLAAIGPEMQKYLWWKKYLTTIQMIQFIAVIVHALQLLFRNPCNYPVFFSYLVLPMAVMFLVLFASFYRKAYNKPEKVKRKSSILEKEFKNYPDSFRSTS